MQQRPHTSQSPACTCTSSSGYVQCVSPQINRTHRTARITYFSAPAHASTSSRCKNGLHDRVECRLLLSHTHGCKLNLKKKVKAGGESIINISLSSVCFVQDKLGTSCYVILSNILYYCDCEPNCHCFILCNFSLILSIKLYLMSLPSWRSHRGITQYFTILIQLQILSRSYTTVFLTRFGSFLELSSTFAKQ